MKNSPLLSLVVLLAVWLPLTVAGPSSLVTQHLIVAGPSSHVNCVGGGVYVANSTYEANRRRLAALLPEEVSAARGSYTYRAVGYWPNRLQASSLCRRRDDDGTGSSYSCAACIAGAFLEIERACPYHREAFFYGRNCTLELGEFRIFVGIDGIYEGNILKQALASGLIFQAIGFACLFFLLLQEWRDQRKAL